MVLNAIPGITVTNLYCDTWGQDSYWLGYPLQKGEVVTVKDPDGVVCGKTDTSCVQNIVWLSHVYGDDPTTSGIDEGAVYGDMLRFYINGMYARILSCDPGPDPIWQDKGNIHVELEAGLEIDCEIPIYLDWNLISFHSAPADRYQSGPGGCARHRVAAPLQLSPRRRRPAATGDRLLQRDLRPPAHGHVAR